MKKIFVIGASVLSLLVTPYSAGYSQSEKVKVGYFENEIFQEGAAYGAVKRGYAYEYYRKLSEYTGWQYDYVYGSYPELYQKLIKGEIDLLAGLAKTDDRLDIIGYPTLPMGSETYNMVKHSADKSITTEFDTLENKRIGVLDSAIFGVLSKFLTKNNINAEIVKYPNTQDLLAAFDNYDVDIMVAESDGTYSRDNADLLYSFGSSEYYLAVNINKPELLEELNKAQAGLSAEEATYVNSLGIKYHASSISGRSLSESEKAWLENHKTIRMGYLNHYMPYSDSTPEKTPAGLAAEIFPSIISEGLGIDDLTFEYQGFDNYDDMIKAVNDEQIDVAFPVGGGLYFAEEGGIYLSNPVAASSTELVYKGDYNENKLQVFGINKNNRMQYYYVKEHFPAAEIKFYNSIEECLEAVNKGEVTCTTLNGLRANNILKNRKFRELSLKQLGHYDNRSFGVKIGNEGLLKLLNRAVTVTGKDRLEALAYRHVDALHNYSALDLILDNLELIIAALAGLVGLFLWRESKNAKKSAEEKEAASKILEETNLKLAAAAKEADSANRAKTYFLSAMSHDIRTPMNSILSMNEMILREGKDKDILFYAENIRSAGNTLLGLINDVLDFTKIEAGKLNVITVDYELSSMLNDLINMAKTRADEKGLKITVNVNSKMPNSLHGDEIRLKQILTNLLTNAVKYTPKGEVIFNVGYENANENNALMLKISVEDTGMGIKKEDMNKLFKPFERIDEINNRNIEGTGLGLTITRKLLSLMGSKLEIESEYGKGSKFSFSVKQGVVKDTPIGDYESAFRRSFAERKMYREKFTAPTAEILAVDDTHVNLTVFKSLLKRTKIKIDTADSADAGIALALKKKYDLIFLDYMMPQKDGIEALKELKAAKDNKSHDTPCICLTANAISGMREMYLAAGFDDYLTKPINPDILENAIIRFLPKEKIEQSEDEEETKGQIPGFLYHIEGLDVKKGLVNCAEEEIFLGAIQTYAQNAKASADEIENYFKNDDRTNVIIKVHGLKSSSKLIGATHLGEFAAELEKAGKSGDYDKVANNIDALLKEYRKLEQDLSPLFKDTKDSNKKPEIAYEKLHDIYNELKTMVEAFDYDKIEGKVSEFEKCEIPENEKEKVEKIIKAVSKFEYDEIANIINEKR